MRNRNDSVTFVGELLVNYCTNSSLRIRIKRRSRLIKQKNRHASSGGRSAVVTVGLARVVFVSCADGLELEDGPRHSKELRLSG